MNCGNGLCEIVARTGDEIEPPLLKIIFIPHRIPQKLPFTVLPNFASTTNQIGAEAPRREGVAKIYGTKGCKNLWCLLYSPQKGGEVEVAETCNATVFLHFA